MELKIKERAGTAATAAEALTVFGEYLFITIGDLALQEVKREIGGTASVLLKHLIPAGHEEQPAPFELPPGVFPITQVIERPTSRIN